MVRSAASLFAALLLSLPSVAIDEEPDEVVGIRPSKLRSLQSLAHVPLLLDVRTSYEYDAGHIPGAVNIPHTELQERQSEVRAAGQHGVVVYCMRGPRARVGEKILGEQEIHRLYHLEGGFRAWRRAGYSVEKSERRDGNGAEE